MGASEVAAYFVVLWELAGKAVRAVHGDFFPASDGGDTFRARISG